MRCLALVLALSLLAACSSGDDDGPQPGTVDANAEPPALVTEFLDHALASPGAVAFSAIYDVLTKLGGERHEVGVEVDPSGWRITVGELTVTDAEGDRLLAPFGVFSGFYSSGPRNQLLTAARRVGAGTPSRSTRHVAGLDLDCLTIPLGTRPVVTACVTPDGVFGYVEDAAKTITLTAYSRLASRVDHDEVVRHVVQRLGA